MDEKLRLKEAKQIKTIREWQKNLSLLYFKAHALFTPPAAPERWKRLLCEWGNDKEVLAT